jgi:hypothetical protein
VWFNTTDSKPADGSNNSAGGTNGNSTTDVNHMLIHSTTSSITVDFDNFQVAATDF